MTPAVPEPAQQAANDAAIDHPAVFEIHQDPRIGNDVRQPCQDIEQLGAGKPRDAHRQGDAFKMRCIHPHGFTPPIGHKEGRQNANGNQEPVGVHRQGPQMKEFKMHMSLRSTVSAGRMYSGLFCKDHVIRMDVRT